jgi:hypothetical protein
MNPTASRMLAVDLRSTRVGFAVIENPIRLVDWGKRALAADSCSALILCLLHRYGITLMVIRGVAVGSRSAHNRDFSKPFGRFRALSKPTQNSGQFHELAVIRAGDGQW